MLTVALLTSCPGDTPIIITISYIGVSCCEGYKWLSGSFVWDRK